MTLNETSAGNNRVNLITISKSLVGESVTVRDSSSVHIKLKLLQKVHSLGIVQ